MDKCLSSENVPPPKKLKQVTLNFFKATPSPDVTKSKKRKNSSPIESPSKSVKLNKPLMTKDPPNSPSKQIKSSRIPVDKDIINDHEVSSSSEADSGSSRTTDEKSSLFERFVRKVPKEHNQEISSTNDDTVEKVKHEGDHTVAQSEVADCIVIDDDDSDLGSQQNQIISSKDEIKIENNDNENDSATDHVGRKERNVSNDEKTKEKNENKDTNVAKAKSKEEGILSQSKGVASDDKVLNKDDENNMVDKVDSWSKEHENATDIKSVSVSKFLREGEDEDTKEGSAKEDEVKEQNTHCTDNNKENNMAVSQTANDSKSPSTNGLETENSKDLPESEDPSNDREKMEFENASQENLNISVDERSFDCSAASTSTPAKNSDSGKKRRAGPSKESTDMSGCEASTTPCKSPKSTLTGDKTPHAPKTPKTPASGKRSRKIDPAIKAEMEAKKQKEKEEKELERSAKKRKLEEEKAEKERLRKEAKEAKDKERQEQKEKLLKEKQEQKEKLQKEKEEKERIKEEERKKKEEEKILKEEERKKKQALLDAKTEEKKKKEEERKQKEEEKLKEEEEKKKKAEKAKQAFTSFFIKPKDNNAKPVTSKPSQSQGLFVPFELKKDMHLAPATRRDVLSGDARLAVDKVMDSSQAASTTYLKDLKNKTIKPFRTGKVLRTNPKPSEDIEVVHDPEALKKVQHKVKLLQFHTDYRPPYYGTWSKLPALCPRNPWKKDEAFFDYEVDSDDEWEEEEPGESLSCSDGEEDKGEKAEEDDNEDEEDGWMVPHGYLSEDEGCNEDDEITPEKLKLQQLAKAKAWEEEQKRKLQAAPLVAVGCFFESQPSALMAGDVRLLYQFRAVVIASAVPIPTAMYGAPDTEAEAALTPDKSTGTPAQKKNKMMAVPDNAMPDLIRLVHGNIRGIKHLIRDFRIFWYKKETGGNSSIDSTSEVKDKLNDSTTEKEEDTSILNDSFQEKSILDDSVQEKSTLNDSVQDSGNPSEGDTKKREVEDEEEVKKKGEAEVKKGEGDEMKDEGYKCSISKIQLKIKINAIAVRDRRPGFHKTCWYVHETILKEFDLEGLVCNSLIQPETPAPAPLEDPTPTPSTEADQRSIMDFALSKEECMKKDIELAAKKEVELAKEPGEKKEGQKKIEGGSVSEVAKKEITLNNKQSKTPQSDQKSIMSFAMKKEELAKRAAENSPKSLPTTPKDAKKAVGQLSIMSFAKKGQDKSPLVKKDVKADSTQMETDQDVIFIDMTSEDVEMTPESSSSSSISTNQPSSKQDLFSSKNLPECSVKLQKLDAKPLSQQSEQS